VTDGTPDIRSEPPVPEAGLTEPDGTLLAVVGHTLTLAVRHARLFLGIAAALVVGEVVLVLLLYGVLLPAINELRSGGGSVELIQVWERVSGGQKVLATAIVCLSTLIVAWTRCAAVVGIAAADTSRPVTVLAAYGGVGPRVGLLFLTQGVLMFLPFVGWLLAMACIPLLPASVLQNLGPLGALQNARQAQAYWKSALAWLVLVIPVGVAIGLTFVFAALLLPSRSGILIPALAVLGWFVAILGQLPIMAATVAYQRSQARTMTVTRAQ